jgi:hypothetical protein
MGYAAERQAIEQRFIAAWTETPIAWGNVDFTPPDGAAWVRLHIENGDSYQASLGSPVLVRHPGLIQIAIFVPAGTGEGQAASLADQASVVFRFSMFDDIVCRSASRHILPDQSGWHVSIVEIPFHRDEIFQAAT